MRAEDDALLSGLSGRGRTRGLVGGGVIAHILAKLC